MKTLTGALSGPKAGEGPGVPSKDGCLGPAFTVTVGGGGVAPGLRSRSFICAKVWLATVADFGTACLGFFGLGFALTAAGFATALGAGAGAGALAGGGVEPELTPTGVTVGASLLAQATRANDRMIAVQG